MSKPYPFSAIVAQQEMKQALLIAAVDPGIAGVLVFGERGTGKSTAVRAMSTLLPEIDVKAACPCNCPPGAQGDGCLPVCRDSDAADIIRKPVPVVDLPLGATEDRVLGALDLEKALTQGLRVFEPGLLARANRGFLYIDEVNLLEDHIVDLLLDAAASGENVVEREGVSVRHPARFVIIGSGNPEEGELRPQLLDRFGLSVEIVTPNTIDDRVEVVRRRDAFERDRDAFAQEWTGHDAALRETIVRARDALPHVNVSTDALEFAARLSLALQTDGLRGELTLVKAARALAALNQETAVTRQLIKDVAPSALRHRMRRDPLDETGTLARVEKAIGDVEAG